jgi:hypothetical protein
MAPLRQPYAIVDYIRRSKTKNFAYVSGVLLTRPMNQRRPIRFFFIDTFLLTGLENSWLFTYLIPYL